MKVNGQLNAPAALLPEKELQYPLGRRLGGPHSLLGRCEEEISPASVMNRTLAAHPAAIPTELSRVHYCVFFFTSGLLYYGLKAELPHRKLRPGSDC
jgi:hypothetical protein